MTNGRTKANGRTKMAKRMEYQGEKGEIAFH